MGPVVFVFKMVALAGKIYPADFLRICFLDINRSTLFSSQANVHALQDGKHISIKNLGVPRSQSLSTEGLNPYSFLKFYECADRLSRDLSGVCKLQQTMIKYDEKYFEKESSHFTFFQCWSNSRVGLCVNEKQSNDFGLQCNLEQLFHKQMIKFLIICKLIRIEVILLI